MRLVAVEVRGVAVGDVECEVWSNLAADDVLDGEGSRVWVLERVVDGL